MFSCRNDPKVVISFWISSIESCVLSRWISFTARGNGGLVMSSDHFRSLHSTLYTLAQPPSPMVWCACVYDVAQKQREVQRTRSRKTLQHDQDAESIGH